MATDEERYAELNKLAAAAADAVDEQIERLRAASNTDPTKALLGVEIEAAILAARVARLHTEDQNVATRAILDRLDDLGRHLTDHAKTVRDSVHLFAATTDASTEQLSTWTKWMALATIVLAAFTLAQVVLGALTFL